MRLFLSSENLGRYPDRFTDLVGPNKRLAYIGNAKDYLDKEERAAKVAEHREQFEHLGFEFAEFDLREYFNSHIDNRVLDDFGCVWCSGGNTFLLRSALSLSGMDKVLIERVKANKLAYGGSSAGSVVAGPTLHGAEHGDDPTAVRGIYNHQIQWEGLGLADFVVIPHWGSDWFGQNAAKMLRALQLNESQVKYEKLVDGEVIIVSGSKQELLR